MQNKKKFYQTNWFLILVSLFFPIIGLVLLWTCHKQKRIVLKIILSILLLLWSFSEITIEKPVETLQQENVVVEEQISNEIKENYENLQENINTIQLEEKESVDIPVVENNEKLTKQTEKTNYLLNMSYLEPPLMNESGTKRIGTVLRFIADGYFEFANSSIEDVREFVELKIEPVANNYNYVVVDFTPSSNGLIYRYGLFEYGKLHKENHKYYFENEKDIYGTFSIYDDKELQKLIDMIIEKEIL